MSQPGVRLTETDWFGYLIIQQIRFQEKRELIGYLENTEPSNFGFG
jgi:hypothetical protein